MIISAKQKENKYFVSLSLMILILTLPLNVLAQNSNNSIELGSTWLLAARYGMGIWALNTQPDPSDKEFTEDEYRKTYIRDTLESARTLQALNIPVLEYQLTLDWVAFSKLISSGQLSRKMVILSKAGMDVTQETTALLDTRNSDGGFGGAKGYANSNILDTALALQALKAANYSDMTVLYQAINYLTTNQNSDGGWGFVPGNESNTYVTAIVLRSLSAYNTVFINQDSINKAAAYLLTKQNSDDGFGSSPSTIYETALSIMALIESGQTGQVGDLPLRNAINYLTSTQLPNGSWNDDPYSTALALQALAAARPNFSVSSISLSNNMPQDGQPITLTAAICNIGLEEASKCYSPLLSRRLRIVITPS